jgi:PrgI family protein
LPFKYIGFWYTTSTVSTYKLIQDIEAEDHILGPLTLRQFIFGLIAAFLLYVCFLVVTKHAAFMLVVFLPPALFCLFFAFPWGGDQPTELWALGKLRFWFKPRRRVWSQSGIKELVTINVPKKIERILTDNLSQTEVKSRLQALANTIDSRGWAIKHIDAVGYSVPQGNNPDRLIDIPIDVPPPDAQAGAAPVDDIMDTDNSPIAQQFQAMINESTREYRQRLVEQLQQPLPAAPVPAAVAADQSQQWFMNHNPAPAQPAPVMAEPYAAAPALPASQAVPPPSAAAMTGAGDDAALSAELKERAKPTEEYGHLRTLRPLGANVPADNAVPQVPDDSSTGVTVSSDPAILSLSKNNDLNVATLAREAQRAMQGNGTKDEVVISLH